MMRPDLSTHNFDKGNSDFFMKKKLILVFNSILFLLLLAAALFTVSLITERKASYIKNAEFFKEAKDDHLDVLFLGSSHVINGVNPAVLYSDYGITSYNLGGHGSLMQETYWQLIRALDYSKPDYVVVDSYMLEKNYQYLDVCEEDTSKEEITTSIEQLHLNMDAYPLSKLKIAAIKDLIKDPEIQKQFLFDFIVYHDRWSDLTKEDFTSAVGNADINRLMGAELRYGVKTDVDVYEQCGEGEILSEHTVGAEYLMKIIDECQRDGIGIIVTYLPFSAETKDQIAANTAEQIAADYGVPCLNMLKMNIIDEASDLNDHGHLNAKGAYKATKAIGEWLAANTDISDHRGESGYEKWEEMCALYNSEIKDMVLEGSDIRAELSLLEMDDISSIVYINTGSEAFEDDGLIHLVSTLSGTDKVMEAAASGGPYILINDKGSGEVYEAFGDEVIENAVTSLGNLTYVPVEKNFRLLYSSEDENLNYLYDDNHLEEDIQILLYDSDSGEVLEHFYYSTGQHEYIKS